MNDFADPVVAEHYQAGRPYFHPIVIERIARRANPMVFPHGLDVGCGTGLSSLALAGIAGRVRAVDSAPQMLRLAPVHPRIRYLRARAERLPFVHQAFDLVTAGVAFHWFDRGAFLAEAVRVLRPGGWLVIYNHGFTYRVDGCPKFETWMRQEYDLRFPPPPRNGSPLNRSSLGRLALEWKGEERFVQKWSLPAARAVAFLLTQSNVCSSIRTAQTSPRDARRWVERGVRRHFGPERKCMEFAGSIVFLRRALDRDTDPVDPVRRASGLTRAERSVPTQSPCSPEPPSDRRASSIPR